jgi:uncharacterized repeat protein (TIGR01451 family)
MEEYQVRPQSDRQSPSKLVKVLLAFGLAVILLGIVRSFTQAAQVDGDGPLSAREERGVMDAASVGLTLTAEARAPDGSVYDASNDGDIVYNGDVLTYSISLCNEDTVTITDILVDDVLPENTLDNRTIACSGGCEMIGVGKYVPVPSGVTIWVTITRQARWTFASIGPGECVDMAVWGRVIGQSEGTEFGDSASINVGGLDRYLNLVVSERPPDAGVGLPEVPSWLSDDFGGTIDQDWGDFDRDGDLDLVLGSSLGATVYRNENGDLEAYWQAPYYTSEDDPRHAYGVRWADLNGDPEQRLELVVVGNSVDHALEEEGVNYIYAYDEAATEAEQRFTQTVVFTSELQLVRVASADYDGDGDIDLVASANAINAPCAVRLYRNDGTGNFIGETVPNVDETVWCPCISDVMGEDATAALGPVDYDNDGDVDLAIGAFPSTLRLLINQCDGEVLTDTNPFTSTVVLETDLEYIPYDLAWGDYDLDGHLDLAAAYPLQRKVYVYHNEIDDFGQRILVHAYTLRTVSFLAPLSVDWGDFDGDGWLDLAVADSRIAVYLYDRVSEGFVRADYLGRPASGGQVWSIRGVDVDSRGSLALVVTNRDGFSRLFDTQSSKLKSTMQPVEEDQMGSVAWGDWDGDGSVDLLFGSVSGESGARLYLNDEGTFPVSGLPFAGFGPHAIAFGDITGDGGLEIVVGKGSGLHIYDNDAPIGSPPVLFVPGDAISSLALGDFDDDEVLDVLVGRENGTVDLYLLSFDGGILSVSSLSTVVATGGGSVSSLAVGDYDGDNYLDFAAGFDGGGARIYRNFGNSTFDLAWQSAGALPTRAVAWADYDGDNDPDLAVGNYGADDYVWRNDSGTFSTDPIWASITTTTLTTSLAWGDWNNDGYPDLAVGKDGTPDVIYANLGSGADYLALIEMWHSDESYATTGVAWGDRDGDGDLDLAISQEGDAGASGFYENTLAVPAHIAASEEEARKLPTAPPYVYVDRPGDTCDAYFYSSSEILGNPGVASLHVVTITYRVYDPEGDPVVSTGFEYSLDGELWLPATPHPSSPPPLTATNGAQGVFVWNAFADGAVGEYARFRVRVVAQEATGPIQRSVGVGVSPSFRVRAQNCTWPEVSLTATKLTSPGPDQECYRFAVTYSANGQALFDWDLDGDGIYEVMGANNAPRDRCYAKPVYVTTLAVRLRTPQCSGRPAFDRVTIGSSLSEVVYLPLVLSSYGESAGDSRVLRSPAGFSSREREWPVVSAADAAAVDLDVAAYSTVQGSIGATTKVTMFVLGVNSQPAINSDGSRIAFWSTGEWTGQNLDGSIEIFVAEPGDFGRVTYAQVTSSTGSVLGGFSLSPSMDDDGDRLVFFSDMDNGENGERNFEVFMADITEMGPSGISITQVTHTPRGVNILPDISGDGNYIALASDNDLAGESVDQFAWGQLEIYRAEVVGEAVTFKRVTTSTEEFAINDKPSISEDGRFIAFVSNQDLVGGQNVDGNLEVFLAEIGPSGEVYTQVTHSADCVNDEPDISADGTHIAYLSDCGGGDYDVHLWSDGHVIWTTDTTGDEDHPSISADGSRVAYISGQTSERKLYLYDVIEQKVIGPSSAEPGYKGFNAYPVLSADGASVAFNHDWDIYVKRYPLADLVLSKTVSISQTGVGGVFTYTLTITNAGPSPAVSIVLTDVLPSGVEPAQSYAGERWNDADLIVELHLDEESGTVFTDTSNHYNNATCLEESRPTTVPGKVGAALLFDDDPPADYIKIDHVNDSPDTEITVMFWVSGTQPAADKTPFSYAAPGYPNEFRISNLTNTGLRVRVGGVARNLSISDPEIELMDGEWHHVAVTWYRSDDRIQLYVDGAWQDTEDILIWRCWWQWKWPWWWCGYVPRGYTLHGGGSLLLGQNHVFGGAPDHPFSGKLDEVAVYRRVLSADEIYNAFVTQGGATNPDTYSSPVMAQPEGAAGWSAIRWMPSRPVGVDLPDYGGTDPAGYLTGTVAMTGNVLLMHLNEPAGYQGFLDTSDKGNDGYCRDDSSGEGYSCPTAGAAGKLGNALQFDSEEDVYDYVIVSSIKSFPDTEISAAFWIKSSNVDNSAGIVSYAVPGQNNEFLIMYSAGSDVLRVYIDNESGQCSADLNDGGWHHVVVTWQSSDGDLQIYVDGEQEGSSQVKPGHEIVGEGTLVLGQDQDKVGGLFDLSQSLQGTLDEVAIFDRVLTSDEVRDIYLRGALKVEFEVHACDDPLCSGETFVGSYPDHTDPTIFPPAFAIDVPDMPFFQYRVTSTFASTYSPGLQWVKVHPWVQCSSGSPITCTIGTEIAPLPVYSSTSVVLPVVIPKTAVFTSSVIVLTNTATVDSLVVSDHTPGNDAAEATSSLHSGCWVRLGDTYYVDLQTAVDAAPEGATLRVAGTCSGVERRGGTVQTLYLTKTVTIQGGYDVMDGLAGPPDPTIYTTTLHAGGQGGVVLITGDVSPTLEGLHITGGAPITDSVGGGIHVVTATATISGCRVYSNTAESSGGGVYLENSDSTLINNVISDNDASLNGGGIYLQDSDADLINNAIQANAAGEDGGGLYVSGHSPELTNTILAANQANRGGGVYVEDAAGLDMVHTTIVGNVAGDPEDAGAGVHVYQGSQGSVVLTNTIVADHNGYGVYGDVSDLIQMNSVLWSGNTYNKMNVSCENEHEGDPLFFDASSDYHIQSGSAAIDRGVPSGVAFDLDGNPRGIVSDLGAYEAEYAILATKDAQPDLAYPGGPLTYTLWVANTGYGSLTDVAITDTLPLSVTYTGSTAWPAGGMAPGDIWTRTITVTVNPGYTGILTNVLEATTSRADVMSVYTHTMPAAYILDFSQPVYSVQEDVGSAVITVTLTPASAQTVTVHCETEEGTALDPQDYDGFSGTLTFTPGVTSLTFTVPIEDDGKIELSEWLTLTLSNQTPVGVIFGDATPATLLILGTPWPVPGQIEAEDYDAGANGETYYDLTPGNAGHRYRADDVDIGKWGSVYYVGWTQAGEWLSYTVDVATTGWYTLEVRVASYYNGTGTFHVAFDGVDKTGPMTISIPIPPAKWVVLTRNVHLEAGQHEMGIVFDNQGGGSSIGAVDWIRLSAPVLSIDKSAADTVQAGDLLTYTIVVSNTGNANATGVVVTDTVPISTTFDSASGGGMSDGSVVTWTVSALGAGNKSTLVFTVEVDSPLTNGLVITNATYGVTCAQGVSASGDPVETTVESAPVLAIDKSAADTVQAGGLLTYTIVVSNTGNANATGVIVTDTIPISTTFASASGDWTLEDGVVKWTSLTVGDRLTVTFVVTASEALTTGNQIVNVTYGVTCDEGVSASGDPVTTTVQGSVGMMPMSWPLDQEPPVFHRVPAWAGPAVIAPAPPVSSIRLLSYLARRTGRGYFG